MKKIYAVIDTNVLISALLKWQSNPGKIFEFISEKKIIPVLNEKIVEEYKEVCSRKKFNFDQQKTSKFINEIEKFAVFLEASATDEFFEHKSDAIFYEVTLTAKKDFNDSYLVTGNERHFPKKAFVVSPAEIVAIVEATVFPHVKT